MNETVYIIDDDEAFRDSLGWLLESSNYPVRSFASAEAFLDFVQQNLSAGLSGCVIADMRMSGMNGLELHRHMLALGADLPTIIVTGHGDVPMAVTAFRDGVVDFIEKPLDDDYVLQRIAFCLTRAREISERRKLSGDFLRRYESLTQREKEVLDYIVAGKLNKQIADLMNISIKTVEAHRSHVMEKMEVANVAELIRQMLSYNNAQKRSRPEPAP